MKSVRLLAVAALVLLAGCDQFGASRGAAVTIIDLDSVARALGRDDVIAQQINQANQSLSSQLGQVAQNLQQQLTEERDKYDVLGDEAEAELQQKTAVANQQLQQTQRLAQQKSAQFRTAVINAFRDEVQPYASEIAKARGAVAVITVATPMLWFDPAADITGEVITAMRAAGLERSAAPAAAATPAPAAAPASGAAEGTAEATGGEQR
ncbi:MAG TPA: OmpH family outer membrane protein [Pseudomonadales bacterium]|nr:OmpH family outer membrane protein [Pseudomonadales bacterium]